MTGVLGGVKTIEPGASTASAGFGVPAIPSGARVLFREPSFWERYRYWIVATVAVIALQALLISSLLVNRRRLQRARAAAADEVQRMSLATEAAKLGAWVCDFTRDVVWANESCRRLFGFSTTERIDLARFMAYIHPDDRARATAALQAALATGERYDHEFRIALPGSTVRWITGCGRLERSADGHPRRMFGISQDISERKQLQLHAERQQNELAHLARVSALGELSSSIAHELNQPLTAILSNAQAGTRFLSRPDPDFAEIRDILGDIASQGQRAGEVIRRMRAMLRKDKPCMVGLDLRQVVDEVLSMVRSDLLVRSIVFQAALGDVPLPVHGDRVQLQQVLINLLLNACDAMSDVPLERRRLRIAVAVEDRTVVCAVIDQGHGIPVPDLERIFDTFVSTKPLGIGMGLSICRSILALHGGTLVAANNPEGGATFRFALPAMEGTAS